MKNLLLLLTSAFFTVASSAQDCNIELLLQKPGIWKESSGGGSGVTAADLEKEKKVISSIHAMIKAKYSPMGLQAGCNGGYDRSESSMPVNSYIYSIIPLNYYCDGNTIKTEHETPTYFQIAVNFFDAEIYEPKSNENETSGMGYNYILDMPVEKDGYWYFKEKDITLGFGIPGKESKWLVTYDGKLPYTYVSKKEFLETRKKILFNSQVMSAAGFKDVLKTVEMEKGFKETEFKNDPDKLNKYLKGDYLVIKSRYEKLLTENEKSYKPAFDKIDELLKLPETDLNSPAIVKIDPNDPLSYLFTDGSDKFGKVLIKPNPGYFRKMPKSSPQFILVNIKGNNNEPIAEKFMTDIMKAVDFSALRNMLGK